MTKICSCDRIIHNTYKVGDDMVTDYSKFDAANENVVNKDIAVNNFIKYMLSRTQSMFSYTGLPDTIPASKLELMLQTKGYAFITQVNGDLYALHGSLSGEPDVYDDYTTINVANVALKLTATYDLKEDGVLVNNDTMRMGLLPILQKYAALLAENTLSMRTIDIVLRMVCMISASDDRTQAGAEKFIRDMEQGKISAIGESAFFDGIKVHSVANTQNYLLQFMEYEQYIKASCFNEIGLNANYNMKRENIGSNESALNDDFLLPLIDDMIKERQTAIDAINEKYGTEIAIDYSSAWQVTHKENEKQIAISDSIIEQSDSLDVSIDEKQGVHDINRPMIEISGDKDEKESLSDVQSDESDTEGGEHDDISGNEPDEPEDVQSDASGENTSTDGDSETDQPDETDSGEDETTPTQPETESKQESERIDDQLEDEEKDGDDDDRKESE